ncbi:MAG: hypothetical protein O3C27_04310 [Actinomycetota bacterium]|nr:hypothetical protein [Actinomycetota bacterium]
MPGLKHPLSGAVYDVTEDGTISVTTADTWGRFDREGVWIEGDLRSCDPQMCNWLASGRFQLASRRPNAYTNEEVS